MLYITFHLLRFKLKDSFSNFVTNGILQVKMIFEVNIHFQFLVNFIMFFFQQKHSGHVQVVRPVALPKPKKPRWRSTKNWRMKSSRTKQVPESNKYFLFTKFRAILMITLRVLIEFLIKFSIFSCCNY